MVNDIPAMNRVYSNSFYLVKDVLQNLSTFIVGLEGVGF